MISSSTTSPKYQKVIEYYSKRSIELLLEESEKIKKSAKEITKKVDETIETCLNCNH